MPAYSDTPQAAQSKNTTQSLIQTNFLSLSAVNDVNHVAITHASDYGKHNFVSMPEQLASPATLADEAAIFARQGTLSSVAELCFRRESSGDVIEFTGGTLAAPGWTRLPSGLLVKWGVTSGTGYALTTFPVAGTIPVFTSIFTVSASTYGSAAGNIDTNTFVRVDSFTTTNFYVYASPRVTTGTKLVGFTYLAIGV